MPLPAGVQIEVDKAKAALEADGKLELPFRKRIQASLGPVVLQGYRAKCNAGLRARTCLAALCSQKVMPIWDREHRNRFLSNVLDMTLAYIRNESHISWDTLWEASNRVEAAIENLFMDQSKQPVSYVACAVAKTALVAAKDAYLEEIDALDEEQDPMIRGAEFFACSAYAGEMPGHPDSDPAKVAEFWKWYLDEAIPAALSAATVSPPTLEEI